MRVKTLVAAGMIALALSGACASADDDASPNTKSFLEAYAGADAIRMDLAEGKAGPLLIFDIDEADADLLADA